MSLPERADVVVVGAGITGTALAWQLARRGRTTVVLERRQVASGPTSQSTAIIRAHYSQPLLVRMAMHGLEVYRDGATELGPVGSFEQTGVLWLVGDTDHPLLEKNVASCVEQGAEVELLSPDELGELEPRLSLDGVAGACWEPRGGHCDPFAAAAAFADAARGHGAVIVTDMTADRVEPGLVSTAGGAVRTDAVVVAAGPWSPALLAPLGYELPVLPARAQIGRFRVPAGFDPAMPAIADLGQLQFYVKRGEGPFLEVGTLDPGHTADPVEPDACPEGADPATLATFRHSLETRLPGLAGGHWRGSWSGIYDVTPDWQPAIGPVPGADGVYVAAGLSGHGFKLAPAIAAGLSGLVVDGRWDGFDLSLFDPGRFARGELIGSRYGYSVVG